MSKHNPREFDGTCPQCGKGIDHLDSVYRDGEKFIKYYCFNCEIIIEVNDETDEVEFYDN